MKIKNIHTIYSFDEFSIDINKSTSRIIIYAGLFPFYAKYTFGLLGNYVDASNLEYMIRNDR